MSIVGNGECAEHSNLLQFVRVVFGVQLQMEIEYNRLRKAIVYRIVYSFNFMYDLYIKNVDKNKVRVNYNIRVL